ncbi:MAG TPA: Ig-like domain-containing protein [Salinimicrobium sp.]|nr:Ig-like domain-containing protein [Salinimicrobium sp.]
MKKLLAERAFPWVFSLITIISFLGCSTDDGPAPEIIDPHEEEVPVAVNDEVATAENTILIIAGLLENDTTYDYVRITEVETETEKGGSVVDNRDGTFTYTPPTDYIGADSFDYTICDNDKTPNCSSATVKVTVTAASPVAVDDSYETVEEEELIIRNFLDNDKLLDNAEVTSLDTQDVNGTAVLEDDGSITYTPEEGFSGEDSFTYSLCDDDETPTCSTGTITITVVDEGSPEAADDEVSLSINSGATILDDILENDKLLDDAEISSVNSEGTKGTVTINSEGKISFTPQAGFVGEDTFSYSICDDDAEATCVSATVTVLIIEPISFDIPASLNGYYEDVVFTTDSDLLYEELADLVTDTHVNRLEYYQRHDYLYDADADLDDPNYVVLMYSGELRPADEYQEGDLDGNESFNTEHIYPQSLLGSEEAKNDMHHMRVADVNINSQRLNYPFTEGTGDYGLVGGDAWFPGEDWKGDVARMVMYINVRYGESLDDVGNLAMFLEWNREDPVSAFEIQRNEVIEGAQGNRNPFIDNPYLATLIWGGEPAENLWQ